MSLSLSNDINFASYHLSDLTILPTEENVSPVAFATLLGHFNTALDSACINHIICDRKLFQTYDINGAVSVKTANCGFLTTLAIGDVKFQIVINGTKVIWTLKNCLHAPNVPINLILVGALQEHHFSVAFSFQKMTIMFLDSHPQFKGLYFDAEVICCMSLLNLDYITVITTSQPIVFASFLIIPNSFKLWHRQFGHLGQEATRSMLTKKYATRIIYMSNTQALTQCIPCLMLRLEY
jgi:hypothetical protein